MLSFSTFINLSWLLGEDTKTGTYACVYPDKYTINLLQKLCQELEIKEPMSPEKLHATVLYSRKHVDHRICKKIIKTPFECRSDKLALFPQQDGKKCLVLKLFSVVLQRYHDQLLVQGGTHDYPKYEPHITLARDLPSDYHLPEKNVNMLLSFVRFEVKGLEED